jgi:sugar phosphate isomerase/epimerase
MEGPPNDLENLRERCYSSYCETIDATAELHISFLTLHLWVDSRFVKPDVLEEKIKVLRNLVDYGHSRGVQVSLENLSEPAADLARVVEAVPALVLTLDVGHAQILAESNAAPGIIERLGPLVRHVHLHDNRGGNTAKDDLHLPIGEGIIDFPKILRTLLKSGYDGTITLELEPDDLQASRETVRAIFRKCRVD